MKTEVVSIIDHDQMCPNGEVNLDRYAGLRGKSKCPKHTHTLDALIDPSLCAEPDANREKQTDPDCRSGLRTRLSTPGGARNQIHRRRSEL